MTQWQMNILKQTIFLIYRKAVGNKFLLSVVDWRVLGCVLLPLLIWLVIRVLKRTRRVAAQPLGNWRDIKREIDIAPFSHSKHRKLAVSEI